MKLIAFCLFIYGLSTGTWWLFLLSFLMWQFGGSGNLIKALWVESHLHRNHGEGEEHND